MKTGKEILQLPSNLEAEKALLGAILLNAGEALPRVLEAKLQFTDFFKEAHQEIYSSMCLLYEKGEPIDLVILTEKLQARGALTKIGGASYLAELADTIGILGNVEYYAQIIIDRAILRNLIAVSVKITGQCQASATTEVDGILDEAEASIFSIRDNRSSQSLQHVPSILKLAFEKIQKLSERGDGITGIPSGYKDFDNLTGGLQRSDLIILAGRPAMGKTALALNIALKAALPSQRQVHKDLPGVGVAIFSLEMSTEQLLQRLMCQTGKLNLSDLRTGRLKEDDIHKLTTAISNLEDAELYIDDTPSIRVLELRAKARRLKNMLESRGKTLGLIVIDYLQLMRGSFNQDSREQEISEISRALKGLAKELNVPVIALSQLNRKVEERTDKRPLLSDLRESGAIEQDADIITFVYREEVYKPDLEELKGKTELIIGKHRNGPTGTIDLLFQHSYSCFVPVENIYLPQ